MRPAAALPARSGKNEVLSEPRFEGRHASPHTEISLAVEASPVEHLEVVLEERYGDLLCCITQMGMVLTGIIWQHFGPG